MSGNYHIIRLIAKTKKVSLKEICENIGISQQGLQKIINEGSGKISTIQKIADYLQVDVNEIINKHTNEVNILQDMPKTYRRTRDLQDISEIDYLHQLLRDKERIISLLEDQLKACTDNLKKGTDHRKSKVS
jgi:transcriptional regulator with XRE-family HTH domain